VRLSVRTARTRDADAIARVHAASWRAAYGAGLLPQRYLEGLRAPALARRWRQRLSSPEGRADTFVAVGVGRAVGFALVAPCMDDDSLAGFAGELRMLYVHPDALRQGIGGALIDRALAALAEREFYWVVVWVVEGNAAARRFYSRCGLRPDGARRLDRFYDRDVPVIRLAMPLNPAIDFDRLFAPKSRPA